MDYDIKKFITGIKDLDRNTLKLYNYILAEKRHKLKTAQTEEIAIIDFGTLLEIIEKSFPKFREEEKLIDFLPILYHTIHLTFNDYDFKESFNNFATKINEKKPLNEDVALHLQFVHQILKTLTEIHSLHIIEKRFIEAIIDWIFSDNKVIQVRAWACASFLLLKFDFVNDIWIRLRNRQESYSKNVELLVKLILLIDPTNDILKDEYFWKILLRAFRQPNTSLDVRKKVIFVLKEAINLLSNSKDYEDFSVNGYFDWNFKNANNIKNSWNAFLTILENLEEKQSHLILPSLLTLDKAKVPSLWEEVLLVELLSHRNTLVLKWSIQYVLSTKFCHKMNPEIIRIVMEGLNNTFLYTDHDFLNLANYKEFFQSDKLHLLELFSTINWKPVPMHTCFETITSVNHYKSIPYSLLHEIAVRIRCVQNKGIREDLRKIYFEAFEGELKKSVLSEFLNIVEALYNSNERISSFAESLLSTKFCDLKLGEVKISLHILQLVMHGALENLLKERVLEAFLYFDIALEDLLTIPLIKGFDSKFLPRIHQVFVEDFNNGELYNSGSNNFSLLDMFIKMWSREVDDQMIYTSINVIKSDFSNIKKDQFVNCRINKVKEIFVDTLSSTLIFEKNFVLITDNVELFLDKGGHLAVHNVVTALDKSSVIVSSEVLIRILGETKSLIRKRGFYAFRKTCSELTNYLTSLPDNIFFDYVTKLLDLDPSHPGLTETVYLTLLNSSRLHSRLYDNLNGVQLLTRGLLYGEPLYGDQKTEYDYCEKNNLFDPHHIDGYQVRATCFKIICRISEIDLSSSEKEVIFDLMWSYILNLSIQMNITKSRYFDNSRHHRVKLRIMQVLALIQTIHKIWDNRIMGIIFEESNQLNVTFIAELVIAECISKEDLLHYLKICEQNCNSSLCSLFAITFMACKRYDDKNFAKECVQKILPWTMGQHFNTRLYAQITIFHLINSFQLGEDFIYLSEAIQESLKQGNSEQNMQKLQKDFRFNNLDYSDLLDMKNILVNIPRITNMSSDELYKDVNKCLPKIGNYSNSMDVVQNFPKNKKLLENEDILIEDMQRKMNPTKEDVDSGLIFYSDTKKVDTELIVVASLITKLPNLGGIARTCEVLGIRNLVLDSLKHAENKDFKTLSMTAEKWLRLLEVKSEKLHEFLFQKQLEGYSIVGAEQTSYSSNFTRFKFPTKCVLLLGHEKDGIPANLINFLDFAVEIPQFGMVRSLNVHVTGALFMWEYCKQHLIKKISKCEK